MLLNETAKNGMTIVVTEISHANSALKGMLTVKGQGFTDRNILFSTAEVADGIGRLMLKDFNGEAMSFVEEEGWTTVFND